MSNVPTGGKQPPKGGVPMFGGAPAPKPAATAATGGVKTGTGTPRAVETGKPESAAVPPQQPPSPPKQSWLSWAASAVTAPITWLGRGLAWLFGYEYNKGGNAIAANQAMSIILNPNASLDDKKNAVEFLGRVIKFNMADDKKLNIAGSYVLCQQVLLGTDVKDDCVTQLRDIQMYGPDKSFEPDSEVAKDIKTLLHWVDAERTGRKLTPEESKAFDSMKSRAIYQVAEGQKAESAAQSQVAGDLAADDQKLIAEATPSAQETLRTFANDTTSNDSQVRQRAFSNLAKLLLKDDTDPDKLDAKSLRAATTLFINKSLRESDAKILVSTIIPTLRTINEGPDIGIQAFSRKMAMLAVGAFASIGEPAKGQALVKVTATFSDADKKNIVQAATRPFKELSKL